MKLTKRQIKGIIQEEIINILLEMEDMENVNQDDDIYGMLGSLGLTPEEIDMSIEQLGQTMADIADEFGTESSSYGMAAEVTRYKINTDKAEDYFSGEPGEPFKVGKKTITPKTYPEWDKIPLEKKKLFLLKFMNRAQLAAYRIQNERGSQGRGIKFWDRPTLEAVIDVLLKPEGFTDKELGMAILKYSNTDAYNQTGRRFRADWNATAVGNAIERRTPEYKKGYNQRPNVSPVKQYQLPARQKPFFTGGKASGDGGGSSNRAKPGNIDIGNIFEEKNPLNKKLRELDNMGRAAALEAKLQAVEEMIDEANERLNRIDEDEEFNEMMDKNKVNNIRREVKQLEKTRDKLQKEYDKASANSSDRPSKKEESMDDESVEEVSFELNESIKRMQKLANIITENKK